MIGCRGCPSNLTLLSKFVSFGSEMVRSSARSYHRGIAFPPIQELRVSQRLAVIVRRIGEIDVVGIAPGHNKDVTAIIAVWWEANDDRFPTVCSVDKLVDAPGQSPVSIKAEMRCSECDATRVHQSERGCNHAYLCLDLQNICDAQVIAVSIEHFGHRSR